MHKSDSGGNCEYTKKNLKINKFLLIGLEMIRLEMIGLDMIGLDMIGLDMIGLEVIRLDSKKIYKIWSTSIKSVLSPYNLK